MTDESLQGTHSFQSSWRGGKVPLNSEIANVRTVGSATKVGMPVTHNGETYPYAAPAITTDRQFLGVVNTVQNLVSILAADPDWDLDDVIPADQEIEVYKKGCGAVMAMILEALDSGGAVAMVKGDKVALGVEAGKVRKLVYADATDATDTLSEVVGEIYEATAGDTTDDLVILVELV